MSEPEVSVTHDTAALQLPNILYCRYLLTRKLTRCFKGGTTYGENREEAKSTKNSAKEMLPPDFWT